MKPTKMSNFARARARSSVKRFLKERRRAHRSLDDPEVIHDRRVSIRRLSQCLRLFRHLLDPEPAKKMKRRLRSLMDSCAAVRDCDVALEVLNQAGVRGTSAARLRAT